MKTLCNCNCVCESSSSEWTHELLVANTDNIYPESQRAWIGQAQEHFENSHAPVIFSQKKTHCKTEIHRLMEIEHALMMRSIVRKMFGNPYVFLLKTLEETIFISFPKHMSMKVSFWRAHYFDFSVGGIFFVLWHWMRRYISVIYWLVWRWAHFFSLHLCASAPCDFVEVNVSLCSCTYAMLIY